MGSVRRLAHCGLGVALFLAAAPAQATELEDFFPSLVGPAASIYTGTLFGPGGIVAPVVLTGLFDSTEAISNLNADAFSQFRNFPAGATVPAFTFSFDPALNVFTRSTEGLGPILSDRAETVGRGKVTFAFSYSRVDLEILEGQSLSDFEVDQGGTVPARFFTVPGLSSVQVPDPFSGGNIADLQIAPPPLAVGGTFPFAIVSGSPVTPGVSGFGPDGSYLVVPEFPSITLDADIDVDVFAFFLTYGLLDDLDISIIVPYLDIRMEGKVEVDGLAAFDPTLMFGDPLTPQQLAFQGAEAASGIGDVILRMKYVALRTEYLDVAARADLQLPTGDEDNLLGLGEVAWGGTVIVSKTFGRFSPRGTVGILFQGGGKQQHRFRYAAGMDVRLHDRVTAAVDFIMTDDTHRDQFGDVTKALATGIKVNPFRRLVFSANLLWRLDKQGLRADVIPSFTVEYTFR